MKKNCITVFYALFTAVLLTTSCGKKEGALNHGMKIDHIMSEETITMNGAPYYQNPMHLSEQWNWDGKELYRIDHYDSPQYSENYFYDGRHRIIRTTVPAYSVRTEFSYDGRKLQHIECYVKDELNYTVLFRHDGKKLTGMDWHYSASIAQPDVKTALPDAVAASTMGRLTGREIADMMLKTNARVLARRKGGDEPEVISYDFGWNDGNITSITCTTEGWNTTIAYDAKKNPYYQLFGYYEMQETGYNFEMLSENNMLNLNTPDCDYTFQFTYEDDYPSSRTMRYSYEIVNTQNWDSVKVEYTRKEHYTYK